MYYFRGKAFKPIEIFHESIIFNLEFLGTEMSWSSLIF